MNLKNPLVRIPIWLVAIYLGLCLLVYLVQRKMMYFPDPEPVAPEAGMTDVTLTAEDGTTVKGTWWPGTRPVTLLLFHGNAGHRGHRFDWMREFHELGWNVFLLDYRGYGGSGGSPTQRGLGQDADAAVAWLQESRPADKLVYFGESIGGSVAIDVASRHEPAGLILQSTGYDLTKVGQIHYPWLPLGLLLKDRWSAQGKIENLDVPLLSIHGEQDHIMPMRFGRAVFEASPSKAKQWLGLPSAGHNDITWRGGRTYYERIHRFLESIQ
ncbi:MAG: alpha/beta hydrolase [Planctomycetota bacterium]